MEDLKMKKLFIALFLVLFLASVASAQVLTLNSAETLAVPVATKLDLRNINIDVTSKLVTVTYRFLGADNNPIPTPGSSQVNRVWQCQDIPAQLAANCTGVGAPYAGCTGVGTGTGLFAGDTCFTDTFAFVIRTEDVGTMLGKGLRALIWAKMRPAVLTGTNNATLP